MAYTFDEIMAFHPDNTGVYQEIKQFLPKLVPFIGAGLTRFAYYSWPKAFVVDGTIFALRPDLIGEHFVYTWLRDHPNKAQRFLYSVWQRSAPTAVFFNRIFYNYSYLLNEDEKHWGLILPNNIPATEDTAWFYAVFLVNAIYHCNMTEECKRQVNLPKELVAEHPGVPDIVIAFAKGLFNLSVDQDEQGAWETIARLERLAADHPDESDIVIAFAQGLFILSSKQGEQGVRETIARLERLAADHPDVPDIAIVLAMGLEIFR